MKELIENMIAERLNLSLTENIQDKKARAAAKAILVDGLSKNKAIIKYGVSKKKLDKFIKDLKKDMLGESIGEKVTVQKMIKESLDKNPVDFKDSFKEELRKRIGLVIESRLKDSDVNLEESARKYGVDIGPLMKANAWIKPAKLSKMLENDELGKTTLAVGYLEKISGKIQSVAVLIHNTESFGRYFERGFNVPYTFYYDTGRGHRQTDEQLVLTGVVERSKDGKVKIVKGKADMNARTTLMVFK